MPQCIGRPKTLHFSAFLINLIFTQKLWKWISFFPIGIRNYISTVITSLPVRFWDAAFEKIGVILPKTLRQSNYGDQLHKGAGFINAKSPDELYLKMVSQYDAPTKLFVDDIKEPSNLFSSATQKLTNLSMVQKMMALDTMTYLPNDILTKVDRAAMAVSLETRVPLLDHRIIEFAWKLPMSMKFRSGQSKWILREVLSKYVPTALIERPKVGFGAPIGLWLRGPLREWGESLINESRIKNEGFFNHKLIRKKWDEHISEKHNWQYLLWSVLMFQSWIEKNN